MSRDDLAILFALERYRLRSLWRAGRRDRTFLAGSVFLVLFVIFAGRFALIGAMKEAALTQALYAIGFGALAFSSLLPLPGARGIVELTTGPFQQQVGSRHQLRQWLALRASVLFVTVAIFAAAIIASIDLVHAALALLLILAGGLAVAAPYLLITPRPAKAAGEAAAPRTLPRHSANPALLLLGVAARGHPAGLPAPLIVVGLAIFALAAAPLAARNNADPLVGASLAGTAGLLAGLCLFPGVRLIQALGREAAATPRLYIWLFGLPAGLAVLIAGSGSVVSGAAPLMVAAVAASAGAGVAGLALILLLHSLTRFARLVPISMTAEAIMLWLFVIYMSLFWPLWIALRLFLLVKGSRRSRWSYR